MADRNTDASQDGALAYTYLVDHPQMLPTLSALLHAQWGDRAFCASRAGIEKRFIARMHRDAVPFTLIALEPASPDRLVGTASISLHELPEFSDRRFWLSEVCVDPAMRGRGMGRRLVEMCQSRAAELGVARLNLYTFSQTKFYESLGWQQDASVVLEGLRHAVMSIDLSH
ncbi:GNAT family N-acetyltransferase [Labrys neptuniae]